ncbi:MAG: hypothetical protein QW420_07475 [Candidatus Caldarchaeum sp.]
MREEVTKLAGITKLNEQIENYKNKIEAYRSKWQEVNANHQKLIENLQRLATTAEGNTKDVAKWSNDLKGLKPDFILPEYNFPNKNTGDNIGYLQSVLDSYHKYVGQLVNDYVRPRLVQQLPKDNDLENLANDVEKLIDQLIKDYRLRTLPRELVRIARQTNATVALSPGEAHGRREVAKQVLNAIWKDYTGEERKYGQGHPQAHQRKDYKGEERK